MPSGKARAPRFSAPSLPWGEGGVHYISHVVAAGVRPDAMHSGDPLAAARLSSTLTVIYRRCDNTSPSPLSMMTPMPARVA